MPAATKRRIEKNLHVIRDRLAEACVQSGRDADAVRIIAVTKSVEFDTIKHLLDLGLTELGENRAQQLAERAAQLDAYLGRRRTPLPAPVRWHMIGHLQRNKVKTVLPLVTAIHSVDSLRLAEEISERAAARGLSADIFLQVNCSNEEQKFGCAMGAAAPLADMIASLPHVRLTGLMTMGPRDGNPAGTENAFARLRELFEELQKEVAVAQNLRELSMGMSGDYEIAARQGATLVRIGSALFA